MNSRAQMYINFEYLQRLIKREKIAVGLFKLFNIAQIMVSKQYWGSLACTSY